MSETEIVAVLTAVLGYAQQWLRGFRWYSDGVTLGVTLLFAVLTALLVDGHATEGARQFSLSALQYFLQLMGGVALAHMAAQSKSPVMLAPKYNQFGGDK